MSLASAKFSIPSIDYSDFLKPKWYLKTVQSWNRACKRLQENYTSTMKRAILHWLKLLQHKLGSLLQPCFERDMEKLSLDSMPFQTHHMSPPGRCVAPFEFFDRKLSPVKDKTGCCDTMYNMYVGFFFRNYPVSNWRATEMEKHFETFSLANQTSIVFCCVGLTHNLCYIWIWIKISRSREKFSFQVLLFDLSS